MSKNLVHHGYLNEEDIEKVLERAGKQYREKNKFNKDKVWKKIKDKIDEQDR